MAKILLVDDDAALCDLLVEYLGGEGFAVEAENDGPAGLARASAGGLDLVVLDVMLPGKSGLEVLRELRRASAVPVVMLTARGEEVDRIVGLELGADDYVAKPFSTRVLLARVEALLRRQAARVRAEREALVRQRANRRLVAPVAGIVSARAVDPGTTVVAGQAVVEVVDPATLWLNVRFDQLRASGLRAGLPASVALRSRHGEPLAGKVARVEPVADAVTEEALAKVSLDALPEPVPSIGELAEVTIALPQRPATPVVRNASVQRADGQAGVWVVQDGALRFVPVQLGAADLDGRVQVLEGLEGGERVVVYSQRALDARSRIEIVDRLPGVRP